MDKLLTQGLCLNPATTSNSHNTYTYSLASSTSAGNPPLLQRLNKVQSVGGLGGQRVHAIAIVGNLVVEQEALQWGRLRDGLEEVGILLRKRLLARSPAIT